MIGTYDFCGHYEWTFEWLRRRGGEELVREYWRRAIADDSQRHAAALIKEKGIEGMKEYWGHTLQQEAAGYHSTATDSVFRVDMHACPSKGFLLHNQLQQYCDYCDHCMGWIGPVLKEAGFVVDHQHNHRGQCWWELRRIEDRTGPSKPAELAGQNDIRVTAEWQESKQIDTYSRAQDVDEKQPK